MQIRLEEIDFLGLHVKDGRIILQPHIVEKISQFLDELLSRKQIQQFLGIINYVTYHIQNLSKLTSQVLKHLKKISSLWLAEATKAIKKVKGKMSITSTFKDSR